MKRSRARVTIEGQRVLLQISLQIKMFDFLLISQKSPYESYLSRHTSESLKNIVRILESRPQSSKNAQKWTKICKLHDGDKITLLFGFQ